MYEILNNGNVVLLEIFFFRKEPLVLEGPQTCTACHSENSIVWINMLMEQWWNVSELATPNLLEKHVSQSLFTFTTNLTRIG
jgi:hypothetical protein